MEERFMPKVYLVGWVSHAARSHLLTPPEAPSNYKDPVKIREYQESAMSRLLAEAAAVPAVASLYSIRIEELRRPDDPVLLNTEVRPGLVSRALLAWLASDSTEIGLMYGFDAEVLLEIAALEVLADNPDGVRVPYSLWHETGYIKDPYKMLCRSDTRRVVALPQLVKFLLKQDFNPQAFTDPREQIRLARAIVTAGQLPGV